jgi:hypothetical protein
LIFELIKMVEEPIKLKTYKPPVTNIIREEGNNNI